MQRVFENISLLSIRWILAYGFYTPAKTKWENISGVAAWFKDLHIPFPYVNAYLSASFEMIGVIFLILGLFTRWISIPLMVIMLVAIITVHWSNGFEAGNNGFEIPLYYLIMLWALFVFGAGQWSVDHLISKHTKVGKKLNL
ncbi:MAG: hypothetical protein KatS3mg028_0916 [Bacteroidia bacterium]|nr:MAG: hypothetical protein KatS3mg028_0916 [Bacteroidia bacterium]